MQKTLGMMIVELRKSQGMTQLELAEKMGVTDKAVSKWERDLSYPDINSLPNLAEILDVSVDELMQNKTEASQKSRKHGKAIQIIPQNVSFSYIFYLVAISILLVWCAITKVQFFPQFYVCINFANIINFWDFFSLFFIFAICLVVLICTKLILPLKNAFVFMFCKVEYAAAQYEDCLLAVRATTLSAFAGGGVLFLKSCISILKSMDLSNHFSVGTEFSCGLLALIYAFVIVFILLPVHISLKRSLIKSKKLK